MHERQRGGDKKKWYVQIIILSTLTVSLFTDLIVMASSDSQAAGDPENETILAVLRQSESSA